MQVRQCVITTGFDVRQTCRTLSDLAPNLVLVFGSPAYFRGNSALADLQATFPQAELLGCSTAGEISATGVTSGSCVVTAVRFEKTRLAGASAMVAPDGDGFAAGLAIGRQLQAPDLRAILVVCPGVRINGSAVVRGIAAEVPGIPVNGGLAGDDAAFQQTYTLGRNTVGEHGVHAIGLYGDDLTHGQGSFGGWKPFGPARRVTRCADNILYELDGSPALDVYKKYLGAHASNLPASGLYFPFDMLDEAQRPVGLIRTILGVDETAGSLILAGDIDPHGYLRLMHADLAGLVDGAATAARHAVDDQGVTGQSLALLVSCVGRKLVMGDQVGSEIAAVTRVIGPSAISAGFYSYGEIGSVSGGINCQLHNQTMTLTLIGER